MLNKILTLVLFSAVLCGCASVADAPRNVLGFSRKALNEARENGSYQIYQADTRAVFESIAEILVKEKYGIFTKDEIQGFIAVIGIPGVVDTTEVGVFVTGSVNGGGVKVELSYRSTPAKRIVASLLFSKLGEIYKKK